MQKMRVTKKEENILKKQRGETKQLYGSEEKMTAASLTTSNGHKLIAKEPK
jgi:hypothetical protein